MSHPILVSACLLGLNTRYNRIQKRHDGLLELLKRLDVTPIPVCPEQLAGLPTPRPATRFTRGDGAAVLAGQGMVVNSLQQELSAQFVHGAEQSLLAAELAACRFAILKERSPSCGVHQIYLEDRIVPGSGVTTAKLRGTGLQVFSEEELTPFEAVLKAFGVAERKRR